MFVILLSDYFFLGFLEMTDSFLSIHCLKVLKFLHSEQQMFILFYIDKCLLNKNLNAFDK